MSEHSGSDKAATASAFSLLNWTNIERAQRGFKQTKNNLQVTLLFKELKYSPSFVINNKVEFKVKACDERTIARTHKIYVKFMKKQQDKDDTTYSVNFTCKQLDIVDKQFICNKSTWHFIGSISLAFGNKLDSDEYSFDITFHHIMYQTPTTISFAPLYDDKQLTDFELRGEDGSISVHRTILATISPAMRRMFCGIWKEAYLNVPKTMKATLQSFKDYIYLGTLPNTGLEQLVVLASYYMMPDLEQRSVDRLVGSLTADNAYEILEFAMKNKATRLALAILESFQNGKIKVQDVQDHVYGVTDDVATDSPLVQTPENVYTFGVIPPPDNEGLPK